MKIQIKHKITEEVLLEGKAKSIKDLINKNSKTRLNLSYADLSYADLRGVKGEFIFNFGVKLKVVK